MRSILAFFVLILASSASFAAAWGKDTGWRLDPGPDGTYSVFPDRGHSPPSGVSCISGNCVAPGSKDLPGVRPLTKFQPSSGFTKAAIGVGLGAAARISPWVTAGMAAYDWFNAAGLRQDPDGGVQEVTGGTTSGTSFWIVSGNATPRYSSAGSACQGYTSTLYQANSANYQSLSYSVKSVTSSTSTGTCVITATGRTFAGANFVNDGTYTLAKNTGTWCFDHSGVAVVQPTGGLCPTGSWADASSASVSSRLASAPISDANLSRVWREVLDHGGQIEDSGPASLTGPSSVPGPTSTTTRTTPSGTTEVTTSTVTNNIVYQGNTLIITTSTVTNNVDGSTTTTTEPKTDPCSFDPESLACMKLGTPPTDAPSWETKTVTYQADSLGMPAACPAPWTATIRGWSLSMSYEPACNVAPQVRAGVLALAAFMSLMLVLTAVRS